MEAGEPFQVEVKTLWGVTWHGSGNEALRAWFARAHTPDSSCFPLSVPHKSSLDTNAGWRGVATNPQGRSFR